MSKDYNSNGTLNPYTICPGEIVERERMGYKIIAVDFGYGWGAFRGLTDWSDTAVASMGDLIPEEAAKLLFPSLAVLEKSYSD